MIAEIKSLILLFCVCLLWPSVSFAEDKDRIFFEKAVQTAKKAEGRKTAHYTLADHEQKAFNTAEYAGKPLLVTFIYTTCPDICNSIVATLVPAIEAVKKELGDNFNAIVVGFDAEYDTPEMMKEFALHHEADFKLVRFASGDKETIDRMVKDFGFYYEEREEGAFNHLGLVSIVDKEGKIYRQIYKTSIGAADLRIPINELITGNIPEKRAPTFIDQLKSICIRYNPETGEYYVDYSYILGVVLQAVVILLVGGLYFKNDIKKWLLKTFGKEPANKEETL